LALSVLDVPPRDEGVLGATVAIGDNNTTGAFLGQKFTLDVAEVKPDCITASSLFLNRAWVTRISRTV
jgi:hypothetical protein